MKSALPSTQLAVLANSGMALETAFSLPNLGSITGRSLIESWYQYLVHWLFRRCLTVRTLVTNFLNSCHGFQSFHHPPPLFFPRKRLSSRRDARNCLGIGTQMGPLWLRESHKFHGRLHEADLRYYCTMFYGNEVQLFLSGRSSPLCSIDDEGHARVWQARIPT